MITVILVSCFAVSAFAADEPDSAIGVWERKTSTITTVSGYGQFDVEGYFMVGSDKRVFTSVNVGYYITTNGLSVKENSFCFSNGDSNTSTSANFYITGGQDVSNPEFFSWLTENFNYYNPVVKGGVYSLPELPEEYFKIEGFSFVSNGVHFSDILCDVEIDFDSGANSLDDDVSLYASGDIVDVNVYYDDLLVYTLSDGWIDPEYRFVSFETTDFGLDVVDIIDYFTLVELFSGPTVLDVILELFISVGQWVSGAASSLVAMFWTGEELTFVGFLAVGALAVSIVFLIIGFISRFIRFGG